MENFIFSIHFIILIIFLIGLYRCYDGFRRLRFEALPDKRVDAIPDEDVKQLWAKISQLNVAYGRFFIFYGSYLMVIALINALMYSILQLAFPIDINWGDLPIIAPIVFCLFMSWSFFGENGIKYGRPVFLNFIWEKKELFSSYQEYQFYPRGVWKGLKPYGCINYKRFNWGIEEYLNAPKKLVIAGIIYYGIWIFLSFWLTLYAACYYIF